MCARERVVVAYVIAAMYNMEAAVCNRVAATQPPQRSRHQTTMWHYFD